MSNTASPRCIVVDHAPLTLTDVNLIALRRAGVELSPAGRDAVLRARAVVDRLVDEGIPAYGITTGVGSQKDFAVGREALARYNGATGRRDPAAPGAQAETLRRVTIRSCRIGSANAYSICTT